jgi:hypothetical protein
MRTSYKNILAIFILVFIITPISLFSGVDETEMTEKLPALLGQDNMGREFWFSIPPVYEEVAGDNFVRVLVTSEVETDVVLQVEGKGVNSKKTTVPNSVIDFEMNPTQAQPIGHRLGTNLSPPAKVYKGVGVNIRADAPVLVYVIIKYRYTSDGFLALPVSKLGDRYINMVYQDPALGGENSHAPAFTCVTGVYDQTQINMTMGGGPQGDDVMKLDGGRELGAGDKTTFFLDRGDVWMGASSGHYQDISGSLFEGNKPFAIVSGMHCANFPVGNAWCDYTVEMEFPTYAWGKQYYVTPMMDRTYNGIVRVFASEPNTKVYRDDELMGELTHGGGNSIDKAYLEFRLWPKEDGNGDPIPPKIATIHADKPIAVMYYNTGTQEDIGTADSDPFQMQFIPVEQFTNSVVFPSPNAIGSTDFYTKNYVNLIFELDNDAIPKDLLFATLKDDKEPDWKPVSEIVNEVPRIFTKEYNGKSFGTSTLSIPIEGVFSLKSDSTKFGAHSYGFANYESYGFPTSHGLQLVFSEDSEPPVPTYVQEKNGDILMDNGLVKDMPEDSEIRTNMADLYIVENLNDNYELNYKIPGSGKEFIPGENRVLSWWLTVVDKMKPARATILFEDRAGNDTTITISYEPIDSIAPLPTYVQDCHGDVLKGLGIVTDMPDDGEYRSNMAEVSMTENLNDNYLFEYSIAGSNDTNFVPGEHRTISWWLTVIDKSKAAEATLLFTDESENDTSITVSYTPTEYDVTEGNDFGTLFITDNPVIMHDTIKNTSEELTLFVTRVELKNGGNGFKIVGYEPDGWEPGMPIGVGEEVLVSIQYDPKTSNSNKKYTDSLGVGYGDEDFEECDFGFFTEQKVDTRISSVDLVASSEYKLFPNPTKNKITLSLSNNANIERYEIFDLEGNRLLTGNGNLSSIQTIDIKSLVKGMYIIECYTTDKKLIRDKFIKDE